MTVPYILTRQKIVGALLLFLLTACFVTSTSWAQSGSNPEAVGTVLTSRGSVTAELNGVVRSLARRDPVFSGDAISTGSGARVRFKLTDDSTYVVQENSAFTIEDFHFSGEEDGTEIADFYFSEGIMEFVSGLIGKRDQTKYRIDTQFATIGLRGSGGIISTDSSSTRIFVTLGELTATNKDGDLFVLDNGDTTVIDSEGDATTEQGNGTGAEQTMTTDGEDVAGYGDGATDSNVSAVEIYTELLPDLVDPSQDELSEALIEAIEAYPVLYAELVTVAIDLGLEPASAIIDAIDILGGVGNISDNELVDLIITSTEGLDNRSVIEDRIRAIHPEIEPIFISPTDNPDGPSIGDPSTIIPDPITNTPEPASPAN